MDLIGKSQIALRNFVPYSVDYFLDSMERISIQNYYGVLNLLRNLQIAIWADRNYYVGI